jgi:photosystem II stability/assembly factor-like uncharacterized protein
MCLLIIFCRIQKRDIHVRSRVAIFLAGMGILFSFAQWSVAQWVRTSGPGGGVINTLAVSGINVFAGTDGSGVFLSTNNGKSWTLVNSGLPLHADVDALVVSGTNLFAGIGSGIFLSTNDVKSWIAASRLPRGSCHCLAAIGKNLFAGTSWGGGGIFLSTDNGKSWRTVNFGPSERTYVECFVAIGKNLFAGTSAGVFVSKDSGVSWTAANSGLPEETWISCLAVSGTDLFVGTSDGVFISTNNDAIWKPINPELGDTDVQCLAVSGKNIYVGISNLGVWRLPLSDLSIEK